LNKEKEEIAREEEVLLPGNVNKALEGGGEYWGYCS
jgi:hypothetical protein